MKSTGFRRLTLTVTAGLLIGTNTFAQAPQIRNWPAPQYWLPSTQESALMRRAPEAHLADESLSPATSGASSAPLIFVAVTPCRMMDTRGIDPTFTGVYGPPSMGTGGSRALPVAGVTAGYCTLPSSALAVSVNVTLWPNVGSPVGYLTIWPTGGTFPTVSTLNDTEGVQGVSNGAVAALGTGGAFSFYVTNPTNLFIDVNGYYAALGNASGNTILGLGVLQNNTGSDNTASGAYALESNSTGSDNTADGADALISNTTGSNDIAIGFEAALSVSGGNSNNIHIGTQGSASDSSTIRIGGNTSLGDPVTQTQFFASGIYGTSVSSGVAVLVTSSGQLGIASSSRTVKQDIEDMGDTTGTLMSLRPVRFRYKVHEPDSPEQYGLVAEEVAEVAPDLVARNEDGEIVTVFYDKVNAMLLNQVQAQQRLIEAQKQQLQNLESRLAELERQRE